MRRAGARSSRPKDDGWGSDVASGFALAAFLTLVFVALTLLAMGPLVRYDAYFNLGPPPRDWVPVLEVLDRVGQRAVSLPVLAVATYVACRRSSSWRPAVVAASAVLTLNVVVLLLKLGLGRSSPGTSDPSFFVGGMAYPSGHSANIILVYGLAAYLMGRYAGSRMTTRIVLWSVVGVLAATMVITSLTLNWHWFADLLAGLLVGGVVLELTATLDRALSPVPGTTSRWARVARATGETIVGGSTGPAGPPGPSGTA